jgi:PPOX class probable F420-dependent enzyme
MSTVTTANRPHVVPFVFALVERAAGTTAYWVVDDKAKGSRELKRLRNLRENDGIEFVVDLYDEDWARLWWVRCAGTGRVVATDEERAGALEALAAKYPQYARTPPKGPVVAIDIETVEAWEAVPP